MKKFFSYLFLLFLIPTNSFATFIEIQDAGLESINGIYVQSGLYNNKQRFVSGVFQIRFSYNDVWEIRDTSPLYQNLAQNNLPPSTGWTVVNGQDPAPVLLIRPSLHYSARVFHESEHNQGQINNAIPLTIQLENAYFSGNDGDIFSQPHVFIENMPSGLTPMIIRQNSQTLVFQMDGRAVNHDNTNDCSNIIISFQNSAFDNIQASSVINAYISDISINFIETLQVASGLPLSSITQAIFQADDFDIIFVAGFIYTEQIVVNKSLVINGQSPLMTIVQASENPDTASSSVVKINENCDVTLRNMTIRHGNKEGGIQNRGRLWLEQCAITQNQSNYKGGGVNSKGPLLHLSQCTINANRVTGSYVYGGGGLFIDENTTAILNNCTISGNISDGHGGGILNEGIVQLDSCTIYNNTADYSLNDLGNGGGLFTNGTCTLKNTILAGNSDLSDSIEIFHDFWGTILSDDYNLIEKNEGNTVSGTITHSIIGSSPNLNVLAYNGGHLQTHGFYTYGPAINTGQTNLVIDARNISRPCNGSDDIGAFESCSGTSNTAPEISWIPDIQCESPACPLTVFFRIADPETSASQLNIHIQSDNPSLLSLDNINRSGAEESQSLVILLTDNQWGVVSVLITVTDALGLTASSLFQITVQESFNLDIDGDGQINALSDGVLIVLYLNESLETISDLSKIVPATASRKTLEHISSFLNQGKAFLDIDANGQVQAMTDGILILRYLFEINQGEPFIYGMFTESSKRNTVDSVSEYIEGLKNYD
ncbi:MAG: hypothetical protein HQK75_02140 [Candidatus Magnetomorum sp.]|nr:hypothetical protein [Candidatus Magnetomorum sp.]